MAYWLVGVITCLQICAFGVDGLSKVVLNSNGYENLVIAINPSIDENTQLIDSIKESFTKASTVLFSATKKRAYFKDITIVLPKTWTGTYPHATQESYTTADILIADPNYSFGNVPYTLQFGGCGDPGTYIHLTPEYLLDDQYVRDYGPREKTIVHEWAHYRWGVFDESFTRGYPKFYLGENGTEANRCPATIFGVNAEVDYENSRVNFCKYDNITYLPDDNCQFFPFEFQYADLKSSMMSYQYLEEVTTFCHSNANDPVNLHNKDAPNEHNRLCNLRSTWDVIMESKDFKNGTNPENLAITDTTPTFRIVQAVPDQFVLVMDVSGSMASSRSGKSRLNLMREAANYFIDTFVPNNVYVGLVEFSTTAFKLSDLVEIKRNDDSRRTLISKIPSRTLGSTGIGGGILEGLKVLEEGMYGPCGNLIVLSDGGENVAPYVKDVYDDVINAKCVKMHSIFIDLDSISDNVIMTNLSIESGGLWSLVDSKTNSTGFDDIFHELSKPSDGDASSSSIKVRSEVHHVTQGTAYDGSVTIDSTIGNNTVFAFAWISTAPNIAIYDPQNNCYYANYLSQSLNYCGAEIHSVDAGFNVIKFVIPGTAQPGRWKYSISTNSNSDDITATITSNARDDKVHPIEVESGLLATDISAGEPGVVYAKVNQGFAPVTDAAVTAFITRPDGVTIRKRLRDNGAGADVRRDDGVYSRYFTEFSGQGRYSIKLKVSKDTTATSSSTTSKAAFNPGMILANGTFEINPNGVNARPNGTNVAATSSSVTNFERSTTGQSFSYSGHVTGNNDIYPPNQVTDLAVKQRDLQNKTSGIEVKFTAPGDDYDSGDATRYEIRYSFGDSDQLQNDFDNQGKIDVIEGSLNSTKPALTIETITVATPALPDNKPTVQVSIALRAYDEVGNPSDISNVATTTFFLETDALPNLPEPSTTQQQPGTTQQQPGTTQPTEIQTTTTTELTTTLPKTIKSTEVVTEDAYLFKLLMYVFAATTLIFGMTTVGLFCYGMSSKGRRTTPKSANVEMNLYA